MWICKNDGFFSIVDKAQKPDHLLVRARRPGDIAREFGVKEIESTNTDYRYRAEIPRTLVCGWLFDSVKGIEYDNFKDSVKAKDLKSAYSAVWGVMERIQPGGAYGSRRLPERASRFLPFQSDEFEPAAQCYDEPEVCENCWTNGEDYACEDCKRIGRGA